MDALTMASLAALVYKFTSALKYASAGRFRELVTQLIPWVAGIFVVALAAQAEVARDVTVFGDQLLYQLDGWSQVLAGIALGSTASVAYDVKKAVDASDSAAEPPLTGQ